MPTATAITIGNFDGVHRGHVQLIHECRQAVGKAGRVVVLAFDPHPLALLRPGSEPPRLSTFVQRSTWLKGAGADVVEPMEPTPDLLNQTAHEFLRGLVQRWQPSVVVEGGDFHFGRGRAGTIDTLRECETEFGYRAVIVDSVEAPLSDQSVVRVSSTMLRWLLARGRVRDAQLLLGRAFEIKAKVVQGDQRGRKIGFPTANVEQSDRLLPADGIYAGRAWVIRSEELAYDVPSYPAAISIGTKPTFGVNPRTCEAHLIGFNGRLNDYGWTIRLEFHRWLRDQITYAGVDPLIEQLRRDVRQVQEAGEYCATRSARQAVPTA